MNTLVISRFRLILLVGVLLNPLKAELIFQVPQSTSIAEWRNSGAALFEGAANIYDTLAALERMKDVDARKHLETAAVKFKQAAELYQKVESMPGPGTPIPEGKLSSEKMIQVRRILMNYKLGIPKDEREAAKMARVEVEMLLAGIEKLRARILAKDIEAVQELFAILRRAQEVGTNVALLNGVQVRR